MPDKKLILLSLTFSLIFIIFSIFVLASHDITTFSGGDSYSVDEDISNFFNITINNTDAGQSANITQVNITMPSGASCSFADSTNGSSAGSNGSSVANTFLNDSNILSWSNATGYVINGSEWKYFWFNATCENPGNYNFTITTLNGSGSYSSNISLEVNDSTAPTASFGVNPIDTYSTSNSSIVFDLKCSDGYSVNDLQLWGNWSGGWHANQTNNSANNNSYWNVTVSGLSEGVYRWGVYCNDSAGNSDWSDSNRTLTVNINPTISITSPTSQNYTTQSIWFNISANDTGVGMESCWFNLNNGVNTTMTNASDIYYHQNTSVPNGQYTAYFFCNDTNGNVNNTETVVFGVDTVFPSVLFYSPANASNVSSSPQNFIANFTDAGGLKNATLYIWNSSGVILNSTSVNKTGTINSSSISVSLSYDDTFEWNYYACDLAGNCAWNTTSNFSLTYDSTGPSVSLSGYTNGTLKKNTDTLNLNISASDSGTGLAGGICLVDVNGTNQSISLSNGWCNGSVYLTGLSEGNKTITIYVNDTLNNLGINSSYAVNIDNTAPNITFESIININSIRTIYSQII
jgi:hypothetical protein